METKTRMGANTSCEIQDDGTVVCDAARSSAPRWKGELIPRENNPNWSRKWRDRPRSAEKLLTCANIGLKDNEGLKNQICDIRVDTNYEDEVGAATKVLGKGFADLAKIVTGQDGNMMQDHFKFRQDFKKDFAKNCPMVCPAKSSQDLKIEDLNDALVDAEKDLAVCGDRLFAEDASKHTPVQKAELNTKLVAVSFPLETRYQKWTKDHPNRKIKSSGSKPMVCTSTTGYSCNAKYDENDGLNSGPCEQYWDACHNNYGERGCGCRDPQP